MYKTLSQYVVGAITAFSCTLGAHQEYRVSWDEYNESVLTLARKIEASGWEFDRIVLIARGGMFVGDSFSRLFKKPLAVMMASSYPNKEQKELVLSDNLAIIGSIGKRVLILDDLVDSGASIVAVKNFLKTRYKDEIEEIRTAVIWKKSGTSFTPDYYAGEADKDTWIVQPFELFDELSL